MTSKIQSSCCIAAAAFAFCVVTLVWAQGTSSQSLGEIARRTRKQREAPGHVAGKLLVNEEEDGPDTTGVWRLPACTLPTTCYEISVTLPKNQKWTRLTSEPRPVLIFVPGHEGDMSHAIRLYAAEDLAPTAALDMARRTLLQSWFARPEYFGRSARQLRDEHLSMNSTSLVVTHFVVPSGAVNYRGVSVLAGAYNDNHGFACVFREEDASQASSICDAIISSAESQMLIDPVQKPVSQKPHASPDNCDCDPGDDPPDQEDPR
jgi:hypothetical protein